MGSTVSSCDTSAFAPLQSESFIERHKQEKNESNNNATHASLLSSTDIVNNLTQQFGDSAQTVQKTDGSIDYQAVQALLESNSSKGTLETNQPKQQPTVYNSNLENLTQPLGQILDVKA